MASGVLASPPKNYEHDSRLSFTDRTCQSPGHLPGARAAAVIAVLTRDSYNPLHFQSAEIGGANGFSPKGTVVSLSYNTRPEMNRFPQASASLRNPEKSAAVTSQRLSLRFRPHGRASPR